MNSRGATNPWFKECMDSLRTQSCPIELMVVDNNDHGLTIGAAWNLAAREATTKWLFPFGDDDRAAADLVAHLLAYGERVRAMPVGTEVVMVTSALTAIDHEGRTLGELKQHHTGMWLREYLLTQPFNEELSKHVGVELRQRLDRFTALDGKVRHFATGHHYGLQYRQHVGMVSGIKVMRKPGQNIHMVN